MHRVWTVLLLLVTIVVAGGVVYVLVHDDKVPDAGKTPGVTVAAASPGAGSDTSGSGASTSRSSSGTATTAATKVAFVGDNWTKGDGTSAAAKRFTTLVASALKVPDVVIAADGAGYAKKGSDGKTYGDLVDDVVSGKPTIVVVTGGRNDVSDDQNTLTKDAKNFFAALKSKLPRAKLVAVAPFWGDSDHPNDLSKVNDAVKSGVTAAGGTYLDLPDPIHNHSDWMADDANPNDAGNAAIAAALEPKLKPLLTG